jgi:hypothetical protein
MKLWDKFTFLAYYLYFEKIKASLYRFATASVV